MNLRVLDDVILFGVDSARSRAYLSFLRHAGLRPAACLLLCPTDASKGGTPAATNLFDNLTPLAEAARESGVKLVEVPTGDINSPEAAKALAECPQQIAIFSGPAGALVKAPLFETGKTFLHVHPGKLPQYRGSTTMYYSLLAEGKISVSALTLNPKIDQGPVIDVMDVEIPEDLRQLDHVFDPVIRARLLVRVLERRLETGKFEAVTQGKCDDPTYFIIHPVLKHIAIMSKSHSKIRY